MGGARFADELGCTLTEQKGQSALAVVKEIKREDPGALGVWSVKAELDVVCSRCWGVGLPGRTCKIRRIMSTLQSHGEHKTR